MARPNYSGEKRRKELEKQRKKEEKKRRKLEHASQPEIEGDSAEAVNESTVHAIYAADDVPSEFQADIEINATEARRVQESGQGAIEKKKDPLPTAAQRKAELGY